MNPILLIFFAFAVLSFGLAFFPVLTTCLLIGAVFAFALWSLVREFLFDRTVDDPPTE